MAGYAAARLLPPYAPCDIWLPCPLSIARSTLDAHPDSRPRGFSRWAPGPDLNQWLAHADDRPHRAEALEGDVCAGFTDRFRAAGVRLRSGAACADAAVCAAARAQTPERAVHADRAGAVLRLARTAQSFPRMAASPDGGGRRGVGGGAPDGNRFGARRGVVLRIPGLGDRRFHRGPPARSRGKYSVRCRYRQGRHRRGGDRRDRVGAVRILAARAADRGETAGLMEPFEVTGIQSRQLQASGAM